ncbi:efflux RND transporter periplasmic adaptor subunit [Laribacter hongkongensis]|uniref:efflux RND transporter periplasmic adaptor subunit n=1 Tax=Laribacter hongkongensis TaxID=168471 RepID=UPI001EFE8E08|nr:efflux RND transporter periplasmic adaptor subunit [Laribacter hongkongensis]MCG9065612.1 efflux RND transporter periplasmic adaptor subunit [Laribacter hongkongensis]
MNRLPLLPLAAALAGLAALSPAFAAGPALPAVTVGAPAASGVYQADGQVEAVREARLAVPVAGRVTARPVNAGDRVSAGQLVAEIDGETAREAAAASAAQIAAAQAQLDVARREVERARALAAKQYLSAAALERAEAQYRSAAASARAQGASARAAGAQAGLYRLSAPFAGLVADTFANVGDLAQPGQPIAVVYDPAALRVTASVPASVESRVQAGGRFAIVVDGQRLVPSRVQWLPATDAVSQTRTLRLELPAQTALAPGRFARVELPVSGAAGSSRLTVPQQAVVRRAELTAVYVLRAKGAPELRYVRLGDSLGSDVEVLAGLRAGERMVTTPEAAARRTGGH